MILLVAVLAAATPARARHLRAEEDPRLGGSAKAFARARVAFDAPKDRAEVAGDVEVKLRVSGYDFVGGAHAHLIVDNLPAFQVDDVSAPLAVRGLSPGPHLLRAVLCRPWHEVVKAKHAFALVRFWSGPRPSSQREAAKQEKTAWPDPRRPLLTYVFPAGEQAAASEVDVVSPEKVAAAQAVAAKPQVAATAVATAPSMGEDYSSYAQPAPPPPPKPVPPPEPKLAAPPPTPPRRPRPIALDFYLSNAHLARGRRGSKVRIVLDKKELQLVNAWHPRPLGKLRPGVHHITIDLLDRLALKVPGPLNRTDRRFTVP